MRVLITSFGAAWTIVPELFGFTNPDDLPLYAEHPEAEMIDATRRHFSIRPVDEIWLLTTAGTKSKQQLVRRWAQHWPKLRVRAWWPKGVSDLRREEDTRRFAELAHRILAYGREQNAELLLSLAGGRKTMSSELQRAGEAFGYEALLHVIDRMDDDARDELRQVESGDEDPFQRPLCGALAGAFLPLVVAGKHSGSDAVVLNCKDEIDAVLRDWPEQGEVACKDKRLSQTVDKVRREADALRANYALQLSMEEEQGNFRALYMLPHDRIELLRRQRIGVNPNSSEEERDWLRRLPKAELHCHLGGVLSVAEMVQVAKEEEKRIFDARKRNARFDAAMEKLKVLVRAEDLAGIRRWLGDGDRPFRTLRYRWEGVPQPLSVCGFLLAFAENEALLDALLYGDLKDPSRFCGIGIGRYEALGDLQGSGLLQSRQTIRATIRVLAQQCRKENVRYLELRCSPANYAKGELCDEDAVLDALLDALDEVCSDDFDVRLIFIASRHRGLESVKKHVALVQRWQCDARFQKRFVGFDLAGDESAKQAKKFRQAFRPLHERIVRITVHAGETESVQSIWQAAYELQADRIGHGLSLINDERLLQRFCDRGVAIEMCPSSNDQIVGFRDYLLNRGQNTYPLRAYLQQGLRVVVNTDNPGISRTSFSGEFLKAAAMSEEGLSRWEVLQLIRNGFRAAFCERPQRRQHLLAAERSIVCLLQG